jgi:hypothetical protein
VEIKNIKIEAYKKCWKKINSMIVHGDLPGNGCDEVAKRNGIILSANVIAEMISMIEGKNGR